MCTRTKWISQREQDSDKRFEQQPSGLTKDLISTITHRARSIISKLVFVQGSGRGNQEQQKLSLCFTSFVTSLSCNKGTGSLLEVWRRVNPPVSLVPSCILIVHTGIKYLPSVPITTPLRASAYQAPQAALSNPERTHATMDTWMSGPLRGLFVRQLSDNYTTSVATEAVDLIPFDVTLALAGGLPVDTVELTLTVSEWLEANFGESVAERGYKYNFRQVSLRELIDGVQTQSSYKITFEGRSYWRTDRVVPTDTEVGAMQLDGLGNQDSLLAKLQAADDSTGLGSSVVDARSDLNNNALGPLTAANSGYDGIIIAAIVIAVLASLLLGFALYMAWRSGQSGKETLGDTTEQHPDADGTVDEIPRQGVFTTAGPYPESVISDDISSSLSAYYKQGMTGGYRTNRDQSGALNDAASVSSMESYGYSLDGYASSIANN